MDNNALQIPILASDSADHGYPMDIMTAIISQVHDRSTLLSLCLTNRFVGHEGRRLLYQNLGLDLGYLPLPRFKRLLASLASNPNLPPLVQRFTIFNLTRTTQYTEETLHQLIKVEKGYVKQSDLLEQLFSILVGKILPHMVNLKELSYRSRLVDDTGPLLLAPGGSAPFQLRILRWSNKWEGPFIDFIKTQKHLRVLSLSRCPSYTIINHRIPQEICARLTGISGDHCVIEAILPFAPRAKHVVMRIGSPREVGGIFGPVVDMTAEGHLARAMPQLTSLAFFNNGWRDCIPISTFGAPALSGLRVLALTYVQVVDEEQSADITAISHLPNLELFILLPRHSRDILTEFRMANLLMKRSKSLKEIVMSSHDFLALDEPKKASSPFWFIFRRDDPLPRKVDWSQEMMQFLLPVNETASANNPGWIDKGPLTLPPAAHRLLDGWECGSGGRVSKGLDVSVSSVIDVDEV